jgi:hypothetical protein
MSRAAGAPTRLDRRLHRSYRKLFAIRRWVWTRISPAGALVVWALVAAGSFTDVSQTMAHQIFAFLGCILLTSILWTLGRRPRLSIDRFAPSNATVDSPFRVRARIQSHSRGWQRGHEFREGAPDPRPTVEEFAAFEEPGESSRNWFDRHYRFYRWRWLCQRNTRILPEPILIPDVPPRGHVELNYELVPLRRGRLTLTTAQAARIDPFGLLRRIARIQETSPTSVVVYPRRFRLPPLPLPGSARQLQGGGIALAGCVGDSEEFTSVRDYRPGDPPRKIHWAGWARTQRPVVKEFQEEYFVRHAMVLDTFGAGPETEIFEEAVSLAASFACTVDRLDTLLDLMFVGDRAYVFTAGRGLAHSAQMLEILAGVELHPSGRTESLTELVLAHVGRLSGCVLILLHWDEARQQLRRQLEVRKVPTLTFILRSESPPAGLELPPHTHWIRSGEVQSVLDSLGSAAAHGR